MVRDLQSTASRESVGELGLYRLAMRMSKANLKEAYNYLKGCY